MPFALFAPDERHAATTALHLAFKKPGKPTVVSPSCTPNQGTRPSSAKGCAAKPHEEHMPS